MPAVFCTRPHRQCSTPRLVPLHPPRLPQHSPSVTLCGCADLRKVTLHPHRCRCGRPSAAIFCPTCGLQLLPSNCPHRLVSAHHHPLLTCAFKTLSGSFLSSLPVLQRPQQLLG